MRRRCITGRGADRPDGWYSQLSIATMESAHRLDLGNRQALWITGLVSSLMRLMRGTEAGVTQRLPHAGVDARSGDLEGEWGAAICAHCRQFRSVTLSMRFARRSAPPPRPSVALRRTSTCVPEELEGMEGRGHLEIRRRASPAIWRSGDSRSGDARALPPPCLNERTSARWMGLHELWARWRSSYVRTGDGWFELAQLVHTYWRRPAGAYQRRPVRTYRRRLVGAHRRRPVGAYRRRLVGAYQRRPVVYRRQRAY
jgi:hypothetical protein